MIIDGKAIADEILASTKEAIVSLGCVPVVRAVTVAPNAATESYLRVKSARAKDAGMTLEVVAVPHPATAEAVIEAIRQPGADAVIVQLPLPVAIDEKRVLDSIPLSQDADVLSAGAVEARNILPPVVGAIAEIFKRAEVDPKGKRATVIGYGKLVGQPAATWLSNHGAHVTIHTRDSGSLADALAEEDIVISGAGSPGLITSNLLKPGVILIDAGTSESNGAIVGDADPECAEVAAVFTPVPGGVGPVAVACLFRNVAELLTR